MLNKGWLVERMSERVADIFNITKKGRIKKGNFGDLTIVDPRQTWIVEHTELQTKCRWTPFQGKKLKGKVVRVIKGGKLAYELGEFL